MIDEVGSIIKEVAEESLIPHFKQLKAGEVTTKSAPTDFVTIADIESEKLLSERLKKLLPGSLVVGEESSFKNNEVLDILSCSDETIWIIDPLDGTKNFIKGKETWGIIVSMVKGGQTVAGWIYIPLHEELMICGEKGSGVQSSKEGRLILSGDNIPLQEMQGTLSIELPDLSEKIKNKLWWGSAAFSYSMLLSGVVDFGIYRTHPLQPWDHAAGVFMYQEIGGYVRMSDNTLYIPAPMDGTLVLAPNENIWHSITSSVISYVY